MVRHLGLISLSVVLALAALAYGQTETFGDWVVQTRIDPITDEANVIAAVFATEPTTHGLLVTCVEGRPAVSWMPRVYHLNLEDFASIRVTHRFDGQFPLTQTWMFETKDVLPMGHLFADAAAEFIQGLQEFSQVVLRATIGEKTITYTYPLNGADRAISRVECVD